MKFNDSSVTLRQNINPFHMKKCLFFIALIIPTLIFAQNDVTTFLGIPVDGFRNDMENKLMEKGFQKVNLEQGKTAFTGEFNGEDVNIHIGTNNNKVYRIMVADQNTRNEAEIKNRFNRLVYQFENNERYTNVFGDQTIGEDVNISYEMIVNNKIFEAYFYQNIDWDKIDAEAIQNKIAEKLKAKYSQEEIETKSEEINAESFELATHEAALLLTKKVVWFRIVSYGSEYYITMFYDNEYNHANGEEL